MAQTIKLGAEHTLLRPNGASLPVKCVGTWVEPPIAVKAGFKAKRVRRYLVTVVRKKAAAHLKEQTLYGLQYSQGRVLGLRLIKRVHGEGPRPLYLFGLATGATRDAHPDWFK